MDPLIQPGQTLRMERGQAAVIVEERIGEGGVGVVHRARLNGAPFAVKWYRPGPLMEELRKSITALLQRGRPPHKSFVWPIDLVSSSQVPGFGYVMPLLEPRFTSLGHMLNLPDQPSFRVVTTLGRELVEAFAVLHATGLCYRDISFGNVRVDPDACEVAIIDIDHIGPDGGQALVKGTGKFMAPEVLRDEALPSTVTDLHSLAVFLFYLLMHDHPLEGQRTDASYHWEGERPPEIDIIVQNFGDSPLFVFDPADPANRPLPGEQVNLWWSIYPLSFRRIFIQAFTVGLREASLSGRVIESTWRRALLSLHDSVAPCPGCGAAAFYDQERPDQRCWGCHQPLPVPPRLEMPGGTLVLSEGATVTSHHLYRDRGYRQTQAMVEAHPGRPGRVVLRNLTDKTWTVAPEGEAPRRVAPSMRLGVRPMTIDFGGVQGRIVLPQGTTMTGQRALRASQLGTEPIRWCQKCRGAPITSASALNSAAIAASSRAGLPRRVRTCTSSSLASAAWSSSVSSQRSSESASRSRPTTWPVSGSQYTPGEVT
jgi:eukaryotic-like serine/threonine-protein kinase